MSWQYVQQTWEEMGEFAVYTFMVHIMENLQDD